jgi:hypothetical protein
MPSHQAFLVTNKQNDTIYIAVMDKGTSSDQKNIDNSV